MIIVSKITALGAAPLVVAAILPNRRKGPASNTIPPISPTTPFTIAKFFFFIITSIKIN